MEGVMDPSGVCGLCGFGGSRAHQPGWQDWSGFSVTQESPSCGPESSLGLPTAQTFPPGRHTGEQRGRSPPLLQGLDFCGM